MILLLLLAGCAKGNRPHPRIAELTTPIHLTLRTLNGREPRDCPQPGALDRLWCQVSPAPPRGLTFLEVNGAADHPLANTGSWDDDLEALRTRHGAIVVADTAQKMATLFIDDTRQRVVIDFGELGVLVRLDAEDVLRASPIWHDLAGAPRNADGSIDWARVPQPPVQEPPFSLDVSPEKLDAAIAARSDGAAVLEKTLLACIEVDCDSLGTGGFELGFSRLDAAQKTVVQTAATEAISGGEKQLIAWFRQHPDLQGPAYIDALIAALDTTPAPIEQTRELIRLAPPGLGERMCRSLESSWQAADREPALMPLRKLTPVLAIIAHGKVKCPWVAPWFEQAACRWEVSCSGETRGPGIVEPPLCPTAIKRSTLAEFSQEGPVANEAPEYNWAALLMLAAEAQGPLPAEFTRREARKRYRLIRAPGTTDDSHCAGLLAHPAPDQWACRLPLTVTEARREGCRLVVDDARQTLTISSFPPD